MKRGARLHITGIVQGVGFRPFIYNLAGRLGVTGWVRNTSAGVDIEVDGSQAALEAFVKAVQDDAPPLSRIESLTVAYSRPLGLAGFEIRSSETIAEAFQPISPDVAICDDCLHEMLDPENRRFRYPFINCTNCGPRFTIIKDIPYDRPNTTMAGFDMCDDCAREYRDPRDRRFHAQPIACPVCGPRVWLEPATADGAAPRLAEEDAAILEARRLLADGKIVAVKGLGGFHLACEATRADSIQELRRRKLRVDKPFAVMLPDIDAVRAECYLSNSETALLQSVARPIVLLRRRPDSRISMEIAPGQDWVGVMLPYTPLHHLLLEQGRGFPEALVMTSGNLSEEPIATDNGDARRRLAPLSDALLMHDRDIYLRCDDSVVRVFNGQPLSNSAQKGQAAQAEIFPLRRSRGYAPFPVRLPWLVPPVLAVGSELKNTFCITNQNYGFLSQHIGDMQNYETLKSFEQSISHYERLFRIQPQSIAYDLHPDYLGTRYALQRAEQEGLKALGVQHHHAHVAACMAEHGLDGSSRVIGVALDGTGFGDDGAIWGGEFLVADYTGYQRPFHLKYFPLPGGDAAIKQPARVALALLWSSGMAWDERLASVVEFDEQARANLLTQLERRINAPLSSSMGRLFDAVASLAGVRHNVNYEAQAAIELEALADATETGAYPFSARGDHVELRDGLEALILDILSGVGPPIISARFHNGVAQMVNTVSLQLRAETGINRVALSGGVWQNITLLRRTLSLLQAGDFQVYIHRDVPTNDGGLSLGQAVVAASRMRAENVPGNTRQDY